MARPHENSYKKKYNFKFSTIDILSNNDFFNDYVKKISIKELYATQL